MKVGDKVRIRKNGKTGVIVTKKGEICKYSPNVKTTLIAFEYEVRVDGVSILSTTNGFYDCYDLFNGNDLERLETMKFKNGDRVIYKGKKATVVTLNDEKCKDYGNPVLSLYDYEIQFDSVPYIENHEDFQPCYALCNEYELEREEN